jgi:hypothetical protein
MDCETVLPRFKFLITKICLRLPIIMRLVWMSVSDWVTPTLPWLKWKLNCLRGCRACVGAWFVCDVAAWLYMVCELRHSGGFGGYQVALVTTRLDFWVMSVLSFEWVYFVSIVTGLLWLWQRLVCGWRFNTRLQGYDIIQINRTAGYRVGLRVNIMAPCLVVFFTHKGPDRTWQRTQCTSIRKTNLSMLYAEIKVKLIP